MARGRMLSKSLSTSEKFAALVEVAGDLAEFCQSLYPLIVTHSDDFGRLQGDTFTVKHMCFPSSPRSLVEFTKALTYLHDVGLIVLYDVQRKRFIQIEQFDQHQQGLHKRTRSAFPRVPGSSGKDAEVPDQENGTKGKGTEENGTKYPPTPLAGGRRRKANRHEGNTGSITCPHDPRCETRHACIALVLKRKAS